MIDGTLECGRRLEAGNLKETGRDAVFISYVNLEDNASTVWLGARPTAAGYEVWAGVLGLRGGQDWQRHRLAVLAAAAG